MITIFLATGATLTLKQIPMTYAVRRFLLHRTRLASSLPQSQTRLLPIYQYDWFGHTAASTFPLTIMGMLSPPTVSDHAS